jgi:DNA-binding MarR family transcriptional regulator
MALAKQLEGYVGVELILAHKAHRQRGERKLGKLGLRVGQELVLLQLWAEDRLSQGQLAERLGVEQATISIMIRRMEKCRLVERCSDKEDARVTRVCLAEKGRKLEKPVLQMWREQEQQMLRGLKARERQALRKLLARVRLNLESRRLNNGPRIRNG